eukprot:1161085-Pelagomonas_calceolata.AAC.4
MPLYKQPEQFPNRGILVAVSIARQQRCKRLCAQIINIHTILFTKCTPSSYQTYQGDSRTHGSGHTRDELLQLVPQFQLHLGARTPHGAAPVAAAPVAAPPQQPCPQIKL